MTAFALPTQSVLRSLELEGASANAVFSLGGNGELPEECDLGTGAVLVLISIMERMHMNQLHQCAIVREVFDDVYNYASEWTEGDPVCSVQLLDNQFVSVNGWDRLYDYKHMKWIAPTAPPVTAVAVVITSAIRRILLPMLAPK